MGEKWKLIYIPKQVDTGKTDCQISKKQASKQTKTTKQKKNYSKPNQNAGPCMPIPVMPFTISYLEEILAYTSNLQLPGEMLNYLRGLAK